MNTLILAAILTVTPAPAWDAALESMGFECWYEYRNTDDCDDYGYMRRSEQRHLEETTEDWNELCPQFICEDTDYYALQTGACGFGYFVLNRDENGQPVIICDFLFEAFGCDLLTVPPISPFDPCGIGDMGYFVVVCGVKDPCGTGD